MAHTLKPDDRQTKVQLVKDLYFHEAAECCGLDEIKKKKDSEIIFLSCVHCAGFLMSFEADSRAYRKMIHDIDRDINKDLPAFEL
jgi:hypothetical protein